MLFNNSEMIPSRHIAESIAVGLFSPVALCSCVQSSCLSRGSKECYWSKVKTVMYATDKGLQAKMSCNQVVILLLLRIYSRSIHLCHKLYI